MTGGVEQVVSSEPLENKSTRDLQSVKNFENPEQIAIYYTSVIHQCHN